MSVAAGVVALILIATALDDWKVLATVSRPAALALGLAAVLALLLGWIAPQSWLHILLLTLVLGAVWLFGMLTWFSSTHPRDVGPPGTRRNPHTRGP